jgi:hypothetical protein
MTIRIWCRVIWRASLFVKWSCTSMPADMVEARAVPAVSHRKHDPVDAIANRGSTPEVVGPDLISQGHECKGTRWLAGRRPPRCCAGVVHFGSRTSWIMC